MKKPTARPNETASDLISQRIADLGDWRGDTLGRMRALIRRADPGVVEEWKWMGTPIWSHDGIICTGESYKKVVKLTFAKGASLKDPAGLFNSSLEGNVRRAIDIHEGETVDAAAFKALVRQAVAFNVAGKMKKAAKGGVKALNATWHKAHRMPERPTPAQQLKWHEAHEKHCRCRPFTQAMRTKLRRAVAAAQVAKTR